MSVDSAGFARAAREHRRRMQRHQRRVVERLADAGVQLIRDRLPPGASRSVGMPNRFPGYAATGRTKSQYGRTPAVRIGNSVRSEVGLRPSAAPIVRTLSIVHERGAVIRARRFPYLHFQVQGNWVKVRQVRIRPKRFFSSAYRELIVRARQILARVPV